MIIRQFRARQTVSASQTLRALSRPKSTSPYGRSHIVSKVPVLPPPVIPLFPQRVTQSDGSTFTHYITSPRSVYRLTRDMHNNALWHPGEDRMRSEGEEEEGRLGRFRRRFEGGAGESGAEAFAEGEFGWMEDMAPKEPEKKKKVVEEPARPAKKAPARK